MNRFQSRTLRFVSVSLAASLAAHAAFATRSIAQQPTGSDAPSGVVDAPLATGADAASSPGAAKSSKAPGAKTPSEAAAAPTGDVAPASAVTPSVIRVAPESSPAAASSASALAQPNGAVLNPGAKNAFGARTGEITSRIVDRMMNASDGPDGAEGEPRRLSLEEAVRFAVENNPGIRARAEVPQSSAWAEFGATDAFDPKFRLNSTASSIKAPSGSSLASGKPIFEEEAVRSSASISKVFRSGTELELAWQNQIVDTNSVFYLINPRYDNRLILSLRQPLLRNFWASDESTTVLVARSEAAESLASFEADLSRFVSGVIDVYWGYLQAAAELEVSRRSVALARELVRDAEAKVDVGMLAPVAVKEALADAAAREEKAIVAENAMVVAGKDLQHEVMIGAAAEKAPESVLPVEEHVVTPVELDRAELMRTAAECRGEIRAAAWVLDRARAVERNARNQRLPRFDIVGHYGQLGLAGDAKPVVNPDTGEVQFSPYDGDMSDSLEQWGDGDFNDYAIGFEFEVPFGNAEGRAAVAQAEIEARRASRELEQTISAVALDVDRAIADVSSAAKRVTASRAARELAEENLRNQTRRFELGAVTTKDVLDFQEKLAQAQAAEVRAITDHAKSVTRLRVADGTLLARFGVEIQSPEAPGSPWWYRF
jgi:outer membrane protein